MSHKHAHSTNTGEADPENIFSGSIASKLIGAGLFLAITGLSAGFYLGLRGDAQMHKHFFHSYVFAFAYYLSIALGALFFVLVQHLPRSGWSVTVRRFAEAISANSILLAALAIPIFFGLHDLYHWTDAEAVAHDPILRGKQIYLNVNFMIARFVIYFLIWAGLSWYLRKTSIRQDHTGENKLSRKMEFASAPGIIALGITLTLSVVDLLMSMNPHWFSTMFGVYYFAGAVLSFLCFMTLLILWLQKRGMVRTSITLEHFHDLGKLTFAFVFFWGYIAFSQYMLIWYANIPEETQFFIPRQLGPWSVLGLLVLFCHLLIPFAGLLSRHAKRKLSIFAFFAIWLLLAHALDLYWLIMPNTWINEIPSYTGDTHATLQTALAQLLVNNNNVYALKPEYADFTRQIVYPFTAGPLLVTLSLWLGMGGLFLTGTVYWLKGHSLIPLKDPRLKEALAFENL